MNRKFNYKVGDWKALYIELMLLGLGMSGKTCPISLIIDLAIDGKGYGDFDKRITIQFFDDDQAKIVKRVFRERIVGPRKHNRPRKPA